MAQLFRNQIIDLSNAAYQLEKYNDSKKILIAWLTKYPSDLWIRYRLAIVLYKLGEFDDAIRLSELIINEEPEFHEVWGLLAVLYPEGSSERTIAAYRSATLKSQDTPKEENPFKKIFLFRNREQDETTAALENDDFDLLKAVVDAKEMRLSDDLHSQLRILSIYSRRWPKTIQFRLILGDILNRMGRNEEGIMIIHNTVECDITGQVCKRIWGDIFPYKTLWGNPSDLNIDSNSLHIPAEIIKLAGLMNIIESASEETSNIEEDLYKQGLIETEEDKDNSISENILSDTENVDDESNISENRKSDDKKIETIEMEPVKIDEISDTEEREIIAEEKPGLTKLFDSMILRKQAGEKNLSLKRPSIIQEYSYKIKSEEVDDRKPVYVVMSSVNGLTKKYGSNNKTFIDQEMRSVADAIGNRGSWDTMVFYPDEFNSGKSAAEFIRKEIIKLDQSLSEKGKMIAALLIVGDDDVVPFFYLPNPANDDDLNVPSDSPYCSTSQNENYYEMEWQIGRIPGDSSNDPGLLLEQLRSIQDFHINRYNQLKKLPNGRSKGQKTGDKKIRKSNKTFGYSCAAWQTPSAAVYKVIADPSALLICPSTMASNIQNTKLNETDYAYFNLHGIKGQPNWYGQKAAGDQSSYPMIPIALEMQNANMINKTPQIVFTECCYGAESIKRSESNAMCLNFLGKTTRVFIGSTTIAYGAVNLPLTAADLFGYLFWKHLYTGITAGEAFRRAKKNLATEIERTYGGLDAEIQKTLLSFVFYGDPLYSIDENADVDDRMQRSKNNRLYETFSEKLGAGVSLNGEMAKKIYKEVKSVYNIDEVHDEYANYSVNKITIDNITGRFVSHSILDQSNYVITYTKDSQIGPILNRSIIRVTVNGNGKILKVSFSR